METVALVLAAAAVAAAAAGARIAADIAPGTVVGIALAIDE